jgi:uncharacterized protein (DUF362 family)
MPDRRAFLRTSAGAAVAASLPGCRGESVRWERSAYAKRHLSRVAVLPAEGYEPSLTATIAAGLRLFPLRVAGKRVVLKPNLVEFDADGVINTHPAVVAATVEALRSLAARDVVVAEGPGHRRDSEYLLRASGLGETLSAAGARYVDLNTDNLRAVRLRSRYTRLEKLYLPETVLDADLLISMPKLKTHHWAGVTLSLKNMFGIVPGSVYGWPKNLLHWEGIHNSILDINAALEVPRFSIVDGIVGMEGDGPLKGDARRVGVLVMGPDPVAIDATCARLMSIEPERVEYLVEADRFLGNLAPERVEQVGEDPISYRQDFRVLGTFRSLKDGPKLTGS